MASARSSRDVTSCDLVGMILCAEVSLDSSTLFVGGSTDFDFGNGQAIVQVISFNKSLSYVLDLKLDDRDNRFVSKIRRIENTNRLFIATIDHIYVHEFKNGKLFMLSLIEGIHKGHESISDIVIFQNNLYTLAIGDDVINRIEFATY